MTIAQNRLREVRTRKKFRQADLAYLTKQLTDRPVSTSTISRLERGLIDSPPATRAAIARALKVDPADLWELGEEVGWKAYQHIKAQLRQAGHILRCQATTTRGRQCSFDAVEGSFCSLHYPTPNTDAIDGVARDFDEAVTA
jgi:transcriptional regulator with XRE-family HTH domain